MKTSQISNLLEDLDKLDLGPQIYKNPGFNDEPHFYNFNTKLTIPKKGTDGLVGEGDPHGSGVSYFSPTDAISKSIWEAMERLCNYSWKKKQIIYRKAQNIKDCLDLTYFSKDAQIGGKKMGWVEGWDLFANKKILLPAQLIYLNYTIAKDEPILDYPRNSTGSAGGNSAEMAILNGIYEIVERDSLMGVYLNRISPPVVDLESISDGKINYLVNLFKKYNLELYIIETTTDLGIPSYISLLFDKSGRGPAVGIGAKAGLNPKKAIIGAIGEVLMTRQYTKSMLSRGEISPDLKSAKGLFPNRARLWITPDTISKIDFLIKGPKVNFPKVKFEKDIISEYKKVISILRSKGYQVYYRDCTIDKFKKINFHTYFTLIAGLQSLYLHEGERERVINEKRLAEIAAYFGKKYDGINRIPHPFL